MRYRACYYQGPDGQGEIVLTKPEHAVLSDRELRAEALAEGWRADIIGEDEPRIPEDDFVNGLRVGAWSDGLPTMTIPEARRQLRWRYMAEGQIANCAHCRHSISAKAGDEYRGCRWAPSTQEWMEWVGDVWQGYVGGKEGGFTTFWLDGVVRATAVCWLFSPKEGG